MEFSIIRALLAAGIAFSISGLGACIVYLFMTAFLTNAGLNVRLLKALLVIGVISITLTVARGAGYGSSSCTDCKCHIEFDNRP